MKCFLTFDTENATTTFDEETAKVMKCIFLGEPHTGKTSILGALAREMFNRQQEPTIGIDFRSLCAIGLLPATPATPPQPPSNTLSLSHSLLRPAATVQQQHHHHHAYYKLQLWDCAGQIRFRSIVASYYRLAHLVFVVFDLTDRLSFDRVESWVADLRRNIEHPFVMVLLGNKKDLVVGDANVDAITPQRDIDALVNKLGFHAYFAVSAMSGENLETAINSGLSRVHELVINGELHLHSPSPSTIQVGAGNATGKSILSKCFGGTTCDV